VSARRGQCLLAGVGFLQIPITNNKEWRDEFASRPTGLSLGEGEEVNSGMGRVRHAEPLRWQHGCGFALFAWFAPPTKKGRDGALPLQNGCGNGDVSLKYAPRFRWPILNA
jgi:hypothetical protein